MNTPKVTPPRTILPVLQKLKAAYILWFDFYTTIPKKHRYTLGGRVDTLFIETIEAICTATFLYEQEKVLYIRAAIRKLDTLKVMLLILWETKSLDNKKYIILSGSLEEVGRMLGGWYGQSTKQNSPDTQTREQ